MEHTIGWNSNPGITPPKPNFLGLTLELYYQLLYIIRWKSTLKKWKERSMIKRQAFLLFHLLSPLSSLFGPWHVSYRASCHLTIE
jgi:hypothetical protein